MSHLPNRTKPRAVGIKGRVLAEDDTEVKNATVFQIFAADDTLGNLLVKELGERKADVETVSYSKPNSLTSTERVIFLNLKTYDHCRLTPEDVFCTVISDLIGQSKVIESTLVEAASTFKSDSKSSDLTKAATANRKPMASQLKTATTAKTTKDEEGDSIMSAAHDD